MRFSLAGQTFTTTTFRPKSLLPKSRRTRRPTQAPSRLDPIRGASPASGAAPSTPRVLMLGVGASGKTTLFRQMSLATWTNTDLMSMKVVIHGVIVIAIKALVQNARQLARTHPALRTAILADSGAARSATFVMDVLRYDDVISPKAGRHIARLWNDPAIRRTFELRIQFGIRVAASAPYFLDRIDAICEYSYVPSTADCLRCSVRSTGISEYVADLDAGKQLQFLDLGGQRCERHKWLKCFHNVRAVVFAVSVGDFDEVLDEDGQTRRLQESIAVFEELVNSSLCSDLPFIVVLTKIDLLAATLLRCRLDDLFPQFAGDTDPQKALQFFRQLLLSKVTRPGPPRVTFLSCVATDRQSAVATIRTINDVVQHSMSLAQR